jgi:inhibitor of KinA sporulation pathway (predicted exonuclease)
MTISYVVLDLEATCWQKGTRPDRMETIEIGAVRLDPDTFLPQEDTFSRFVRPTVEPELSEFCTELTGITQTDVNSAGTFPEVFRDFMAWLGEAEITLCTWGAYDVGQLKVDCRRHGISFPDRFENYINLKKRFAASHDIKPCGMKHALRILNIPLEGRHHRGIDDAKNIAKIAADLLKEAGRKASG